MAEGSTRLPSTSGNGVAEDEIHIPRHSFTAFRFIYGDSKEISRISNVVLLGSIPKLWYREQNSNIVKAWTKASYSKFQKTVKDFERVLNTSSRIGFSDIYKDQNLRRFLLLTNQYGDGTDESDVEFTEESDYDYEYDDDDDDEYHVEPEDQNSRHLSPALHKQSKISLHDDLKPHKIVRDNAKHHNKSSPVPIRQTAENIKGAWGNPDLPLFRIDDEFDENTSQAHNMPNVSKRSSTNAQSASDTFYTATENLPHGPPVRHEVTNAQMVDDPGDLTPTKASTSSTDTLLKPVTPQSFNLTPLTQSPSHASINSAISQRSRLSSMDNTKVTFTKTETRASRKSTSAQFLSPQPEENPIILPLDKRHERALDRIKAVATKTRHHIKHDINKVNQKRIFHKLLKNYKIGEIVKMEKMLVLVKQVHNTHHRVFQTFTEVEPCDTRILERWKEYVVVARTTGDFNEPLLIQFYTKREIPHEDKSKHSDDGLDFTLSRSCLVNFYSSLDKTIAIVKKGKIYVLRCHTPTSSIRWFTLLTETLGQQNLRSLKIDIPKVSISIKLKITPRLFDKLLEEEQMHDFTIERKNDGYHAKELPVFQYLICKIRHRMIKAGYIDLVANWDAAGFVLALCWRHYDRLEWVFGETLSNLFWQQSMYATHNLELRIASHYPHTAKLSEGGLLEEPSPIQGFLARLTSKDGRHHDFLRRQLFKFSYFYTENHLLFACRSYKAVPPIPGFEYLSRLDCLTNPDTFEEIRDKIPLIYNHNPYEVDAQNHITWLKNSMSFDEFNKRDHFANYEFQRRIELLVRAELVIDLLEVVAIRKIDPNVIPPHVRAASNFAWNESADISAESDETKDSYLQLQFESGAVTTLKAPTKFIRDEWILRLEWLMVYWKARKKADVQRLNEIKLENIERLNIDESLEANVGESTPKWENSRGVAEPSIHNISSNAMFRPVVRSEMLFQKPKKHSSFKNYYVVLIPGFIILYRVFVRGLRGLPLPTTHYDHYLTIPIVDCYVYSGNTSGIDLLDRDSGIDKVNLGHDSLPRIYQDGWSSSEDEAARCFTLWFGPKRAISGKLDETTNHDDSNLTGHNSKNPGLLRMVNRLGVTGKSMVFMCRSRQERDLWVNNIYTEVERFYKKDDDLSDLTINN